MYNNVSFVNRVKAAITRYRLITLLMVLLYPALLATPSYATSEQTFTPQQLQADLAVIQHVIYADHPDISHSADLEALSRQIGVVRRAMDHPMTRVEAWRTLATLNPILADGHMVVTFKGWQAMATENLKEGGNFFPFEVSVADDGRLRIMAGLGGNATALAGARILSINGLAVKKVNASLLARVHGDTLAFRAGLLSDRFWFFYWKVFGEPETFDLVVAQGGNRRHLTVTASSTVPEVVARTEVFDTAFTFRRLPCNSAALTLKTFDWSDRRQFFGFTNHVFETIKQAGIKTLVIDIRDNGGGDDDMWMKGVLRYIATKPYRWASRYEKRVIEGHPEIGRRIGEVASGPLDSLVQPDPSDSLHFDGKTYLLVGRHSYSSSVLFANVIQDFGFGTIAGSGRSVRADTSGGDQDTVLPNTGLIVAWPRFILSRPLPDSTPALLTPSVKVSDDPLHPDAAVRELLKLSSSHSGKCHSV